MHVSGSEADYDSWSAFGPGWLWQEFAPYFRKYQILDCERNLEDDAFQLFQKEFHGEDGPIPTSFNNWRIPVENNFIRACENVSGM